MTHSTGNPIHTRPERTSDEIAADRKEANQFFAYWDRNGKNIRRDAAALISFHSYDWALLCCVMEAHEWSQREQHRNGPTQRAALRAEKQSALAARDQTFENTIKPVAFERIEANLRSYVHPRTRAVMPAHQVHHSTDEDKAAHLTAAASFWHARQNPPKVLIARTLRDREGYARWQATRPRDQTTLPEIAPRPKTPLLYRKGKITPAGMSYQKALEIAVRALNSTDLS